MKGNDDMAISKELINLKNGESAVISPEIEEKLREIKRHPEAYNVGKTLNGLKQKKAAGKPCPKDLIWVAEKKGRDYFCGEIMEEVSICCMTPMVFAVLTDPEGLIPWMLKTIKDRSVEDFDAPVFYRISEDSSDVCAADIFASADDGESSSHKKDSSEGGVIFEQIPCLVDPCAAILGAYFADQNNEITLWYSLLKAYGKGRSKNWLSILPIVQELSGNFSFYLRFPVLSARADTGKMVDLLLYIKRRDSNVYAEMMSPYVYLSVLICGLDACDDRTAFIASMKKLYLEEFGVENLFWDIMLKKRACQNNDMFMSNPFGYHDQNLTYSEMWKRITGRQLILDADELDLTGMYQNYDDPLGQMPPFGVSNYEQVTDDGRLTGFLLMDLIRNSDMAVYGKHSRKAVFDVEHILKEGTEELVLMALRKDFIRKDDMDECFRYIKEIGRCGIAPALVLKQNDEWPAYGEGGRGEKPARRRRKCHD